MMVMTLGGLAYFGADRGDEIWQTDSVPATSIHTHQCKLPVMNRAATILKVRCIGKSTKQKWQSPGDDHLLIKLLLANQLNGRQWRVVENVSQ